MYLLHSITGDEQINILLKILKDGYLKSRKKDVPYNFLYLADTPKSGITLFFNKQLLQKYNFYLHIGCKGYVENDEKKYIGKNISDLELFEILDNCKNEITKFNEENPYLIFMSNEILVKNNISLSKYLMKIKINFDWIKDNQELFDYLKEYYPNVKIIH
jgi:hypothetical protein